MSSINSANSNKLKKARRLHKAGKLDQALGMYQKLLQRDPASAGLHRATGLLLRDAGQLPQAIAHLNQSISLGERSAELFAALAECMNRNGQPAQAETMANAAVTLDDTLIAGIRQLLKSRFALGRYAEALPICEHALRFAAIEPDDRILIGRIYSGFGDYISAIKVIDEAIAQDEAFTEAHMLLSQLYLGIMQWDEALRKADDALALEPENPVLIANKAFILERDGKVEEAFALVEPLMAGDEVRNTIAVHVYARLGKRFGKLEHAAALLEKLSKDPAQAVGTQHTTLNLLGKAYDSMGQYDKAFAAIAKGNKLRPLYYAEEQFEKSANEIARWFTAERFEGLVAASENSSRGQPQPIFIVGMPRSGTSLTEKILSRHTDVCAGGELPHIAALIHNELPMMLSVADDFPVNLRVLTGEVAEAAAQVYLDTLSEIVQGREGAHRVTDKMPSNYLYLGAIACLFPQAKIIHCTRDPMATGFSCFNTNFDSTRDLGFSQDLELIGRQITRYQQMMDHWREVLPLPIYDLSYEALVSHPQSEIPKLLEFCDLSWQEACLNPQDSTQSTKTASYNQVRQPINTRSIDHWRQYEKHLEPLQAALGLKESEAA